MVVADVFTAISEDRPYRAGMTKEEVVQVLQKKAYDSLLDPDLVSIIILNYDLINSVRINAQAEELLEYQEYKKCKECIK
jgi:HD-GYP domain-containing protein (c-di-GMP phosphodiesterase class II)